MNTLFVNAQLLMPDATIIRGCLGVCDNIISFVGDQPEDFQAQRIIDCDGNLLMPGFVNAHTHLPMTLFRSAADDLALKEWLFDHIFPLEDQLTTENVYYASLLAIAEMLRAGITCINDMYFFSETIAKAMAHSGMRGLISRAVTSDENNGGQVRLNEAIELFNTWNHTENDRIRIAMAPHAEYTCSDTDLQAVSDAARHLNCPIHVHVSESFAEHEECKAKHGMTPLQRLDRFGLIHSKSMLAHCVHLELDDIALVTARNAHILHCPQSNLKLGSGIAPIPLFMAQKINIALGTDGAASNNNLDILEELRLCALLHKGITNNATIVNAQQAIAMSTRGGALAVGFDAGILKEGSLADIIMIDIQAPHMLPKRNLMAHIAYSAQSHDVLLTMVDGRILYERGEYYSLDIEQISAQVQYFADQLIS